MKIIEQSWEWIRKPVEALEIIEEIARTCYKSGDRIKPGSAEKFVKMLIDKGHMAMIEHAHASVRLITNRSVTHEGVRHRLCSFAQESTRYVRYDGNMEFIRPVWWPEWSKSERLVWINRMLWCEEGYIDLLKKGSRPEQAREVLPNSLKTEIVVTANLREWRHIFSLRCSNAAHPQIRFLMLDILAGFHAEIPVIFDDLAVKYLDYIPNRNVMEANLKACGRNGD